MFSWWSAQKTSITSRASIPEWPEDAGELVRERDLRRVERVARVLECFGGLGGDDSHRGVEEPEAARS